MINIREEDRLDQIELAIRDMQEAMGELRQAWQSLKELSGYSDYRIDQEIEIGYVDSLAERIDNELEEEVINSLKE